MATERKLPVTPSRLRLIAPKLSIIGGHEDRPKSKSMGRDEHVKRTNDDASLLQINAQVTVVARGL
jgi:hypothetical protein